MLGRLGRVGLALGGVWIAVAACSGDSTQRSTSDPEDGGAENGGTAGAPSVGGTASAGKQTGGAPAAGHAGDEDPGADAGGAGGAEPLSPGKRLGQPCLQDADCVAPGEAELVCIEPDDAATLLVGAPPHGVCTFACETDADCQSRGVGSVCYSFGESPGSGWCVEGCSFGEPAAGEVKCHQRPDFMCMGAVLADTGDPCETINDCQSGELCSGDSCALVIAACLPRCRGDVDCADGLYCDQSFDGGLCVAEKPIGKALGERCTLNSEEEPAEPDECLGFCQADSADSMTGRCATPCGLTRECAWNSERGTFDGLCLYASILSRDSGATGDFGYCTPTCDCQQDCQSSQLGCSLLASGELSSDDFSGRGLCFSGDNELDECSAGGAPATGGAPSAGFGGVF